MRSRSVSDSIIARPEEHDAIREEADKLLRRAKAIGIFPTPVEQLIEIANVKLTTDLDAFKESFLKTAPKKIRAAFSSGWNKLRGFADLKEKINYIAPEPIPQRELWVKLHETGHQVLPWQNTQSWYLEDQQSLSLDCEEIFEREANDFAALALFQGEVFRDLAASMRPDFASIASLASKFGASRHATARHLAEDSDEPLALLSYYRSNYTFTEDGRPMFILGRSHSGSAKLLKKYPDLQVPRRLEPDHPWVAAVNSGLCASGSESFDCGDGTHTTFLWESWWNQHHLLVLVRKAPALRLIGNIFG